MREWKAELDVLDENGHSGLGSLSIIMRENDRTLWTAVWIISGHAVAKIDMEREEKRMLDEIETPAGRLNRRKKGLIPAFLPHWNFVDEKTGNLGEHQKDPAKYPVKMPMEEAIAKWCASEIALEVRPAQLRYFRNIDGKREGVSARKLFGEA